MGFSSACGCHLRFQTVAFHGESVWVSPLSLLLTFGCKVLLPKQKEILVLWNTSISYWLLQVLKLM
ncbi:unnamed protein product [Prunus brigantina]